MSDIEDLQQMDAGTRNLILACHIGSVPARSWCDMMGFDWRALAPVYTMRFLDIEEEM